MTVRVFLLPEWRAEGRPGLRVHEDPAVRLVTAGVDPVVPGGCVCLRVAPVPGEAAGDYRARLVGRDLRPGALRYGAEGQEGDPGALRYAGRWWRSGPEVPEGAVLVLPADADVAHAVALAETLAAAGWCVARQGRRLWRAGDDAERLDGTPVRVVAAEHSGRVVVSDGDEPVEVSVVEIVPTGSAARRAEGRRRAGVVSGPPAASGRLAELAAAVIGLPAALRRPRPDARAIEPECEDLPAEERLRRMLARGGVR